MSIVDWIFPRVCVGCGREGKYICRECEQKLTRPPAICPGCCKPSLGGWVHGRCKTEWGMERLMVGLPYRGPVQKLLKKVKYGSAWEIVQALFEIWISRTENPELKERGVVTSVPMYRQKERERGFNQAEVLAKLLAENYKVPYLTILERKRETKPMFGLSRKERRENVGGAFRVINQQTNELTDKRIILVDDVWTTGATMRECTRVLKRAGAEEVWGVTLAR